LLWESVRSEFAWEGSWRDICVSDVDLLAWQAAADALFREGQRGRFTLDGVEQEIPRDLGGVFAAAGKSQALWAVMVGGVTVVCHFFHETEVEFDLDPREVQGQEQLDAVIGFMGTLAEAIGKPVLMTPENMHEVPFIKVAPSGDAEYISSGGFFEQLARQR
jgi:hypothetical protein